MERGILEVFIREIRSQIGFALKAAGSIDHANTCLDANTTWYSIQSFLVATANVSKLLWPASTKSQERGRELREALDVAQDSPLRSRKFRNHIEHFDERIEVKNISSRTHVVIDGTVSPPRAIQGGESMVVVRNYDPETCTVIIYGERYELRPVVNALLNLRVKAEQFGVR